MSHAHPAPTAPARTPTPVSSPAPLWRQALAEGVGTALLVAIVVGSGIMAERMSPGDAGLQLLQNSLATTLGLAVLIVVLQPVSGAHFNPVVTLADRALGARLGAGAIGSFIAAQIGGGVLGGMLANAMFAVPTTIATTARATPANLLAEVVATAGLVLVIFALVRTGRAHLAGPAVGAYIGAAYWFTASTSFANPAVTIGRIFSDTFAGIEPASAGLFIVAQLVGAAIAVGLVHLLWPRGRAR
ncbi:MIP family protein [Pseudoclavibacter endophyticus]|uniref:Aquaporin family protein n=1 Tax=Pseudoclavibacter endophyticus TaxID=1778590 RepID=A0A6H9WKZ7_9MICO|nr:MIP/aquaporin family protein [Pseudoclavibacter endophyticus]KAB1649486.1 aquaporin family protein [Pseudoclavibacter endophyticus]GGA62256.1 MIP family protein [Pseudoclavibacter endophyticus]